MRRVGGLAVVTAMMLGTGLGGCGSRGEGAEPATVGGYEVTRRAAWQRLDGAVPAIAALRDTVLVVNVSASGFTRRVHFGSGASFVEHDYRVTAGGAVEYVAYRLFDFRGVLLQTASYAPPLPELPPDLAPAAWPPVQSTVTITDTGGAAPTTLQQADQVTVGATESISVPAGTFQALKVTTRISTSLPGAPTRRLTTWWVVGQGRARQEWADDETGVVDGRWELAGSGQGLPPPGALDGLYQVAGLSCDIQPPPASIAAVFGGGRTMRFELAGAAATTTWAEAGCSITAPAQATYPAVGQVRLAPSGAVQCAPSPAACADLALAAFGRDACGTVPAEAKTYAVSYSPYLNGLRFLYRVGGHECADAGAVDPLGYVVGLPSP